MFSSIYVEHDIMNHPRVSEICRRYPNSHIIECTHYGEIFNRRSQNFRLQKNNPSLILARKNNKRVMETPISYGLGGKNNFYFSHMLNCFYDCRYCFLQGMYRSAFYVLFVNYEDFMIDIDTAIKDTNDECYFFSGYDCDSLAFEPVSLFTESFLPFFSRYPNSWLELRTKSTQIRSLLQRDPINNCIVAYSLSPSIIADKIENKAPSLENRLAAIQKLQMLGWRVGLRFDPIILVSDYQSLYAEFFREVFSVVNPDTLHSVTLGEFRLPTAFHANMTKLFPEEPLFGTVTQTSKNVVTYSLDTGTQLMDYCRQLVLQYVPESQLFTQGSA